jgi:hypothetical protein
MDIAYTRFNVLLELRGADQNPIPVFIKPLTGFNAHAGDFHRDIHAAGALLLRGLRAGRDGTYDDVAGIDFVGVAHRAKHDDPGPTVVCAQLGEIAAH